MTDPTKCATCHHLHRAGFEHCYWCCDRMHHTEDDRARCRGARCAPSGATEVGE